MSEQSIGLANELNLQSSNANFLINITLAYIRIAILIVLIAKVRPVTMIRTFASGD